MRHRKITAKQRCAGIGIAFAFAVALYVKHLIHFRHENSFQLPSYYDRQLVWLEECRDYYGPASYVNMVPEHDYVYLSQLVRWLVSVFKR